MIDQDKPGLLICSTRNIQSQLNVFNFRGYIKPKLKTLNFDNDILVASDANAENIAVFEKSPKIIRIYTSGTTLKSTLVGKLDLNCLVFYDNNYLLSGGNYGKIHVYDLNRQRYVKSFDTNCQNSIVHIDLSIDNKNIYVSYDDGKVSKLEMKTSKVDHLTCLTDRIRSLKTCPWIVSNLLLGSSDGSVLLYDVINNKKCFTTKYHKDKVNCVSYSYYNEFLVMSGGEDKQAILYATNGNLPLKTYKTKYPVTSCSMSDGVLYSFGEANGDVWVYDIRNMKNSVNSYQLKDRINYLQFSFESFLNSDTTEILDTTAAVSSEKSNGDYSVASCFSEGNKSINFHHQVSNESFNLSRKSSLSPIVNESQCQNPNRLRKQVQFIIDNSLEFHSSMDKFEDNSPMNTHSETEPNIHRQELDSGFTTKVIVEEMQNEIILTEDRLNTNILLQYIDQLAITEETIIQSIMPLVSANRELFNENQLLWKKLNYQKRF